MQVPTTTHNSRCRCPLPIVGLRENLPVNLLKRLKTTLIARITDEVRGTPIPSTRFLTAPINLLNLCGGSPRTTPFRNLGMHPETRGLLTLRLPNSLIANLPCRVQATAEVTPSRSLLVVWWMKTDLSIPRRPARRAFRRTMSLVLSRLLTQCSTSLRPVIPMI